MFLNFLVHRLGRLGRLLSPTEIFVDAWDVARDPHIHPICLNSKQVDGMAITAPFSGRKENRHYLPWLHSCRLHWRISQLQLQQSQRNLRLGGSVAGPWQVCRPGVHQNFGHPRSNQIESVPFLVILCSIAEAVASLRLLQWNLLQNSCHPSGASQSEYFHSCLL